MAYDDPYRPRGGLATFLRLISASFRVGRFFGVELRVYWITLILMPLIVAPRIGGSFLEVVTHTTIVTLLLYVVIYVHEMSHVLAGRRFGMHTPLISLSPLGGTAHMATPAPHPRAEALVALAGPASHLLFLAVLAPLWFFVVKDAHQTLPPRDWAMSPIWYAVATALYVNVALMLFNLLPFFPMDGGRVLRATLSMKWHPNRATMIATAIGIGGAILFIVVGFTGTPFAWGGGILVALGISHWIACVQERKMARYTAGPYDATARFEPWQVDPDAWKRSGEAAREPGFFERRRIEKTEKARRKAREASEALEADVDRILDKVNRVGMSGLSEKEKQVLVKASQARKRR